MPAYWRDIVVENTHANHCSHRSYLADKQLQYLSSSTRILSGVAPRSSCLGPLFNIYINDIERPTFSLVKLALYADNIIIYFFHKNLFRIQNTSQSFLTTAGAYFTCWRLEVNPLKTQVIIFRKDLKTLSLEGTLLL